MKESINNRTRDDSHRQQMASYTIQPLPRRNYEPSSPAASQKCHVNVSNYYDTNNSSSNNNNNNNQYQRNDSDHSHQRSQQQSSATMLPMTSSSVSIASSSSSWHSNAPPLTIEIAPGLNATVRGADETQHAVATNYLLHLDCIVCTTKISCIADAKFVLCPVCKVISPSNTTIVNGNGGIGLGFCA
jgi:hypothetical protein